MDIKDDCFFFGVVNGNFPACFYSSPKTSKQCENCSECRRYISRNMARIIIKQWVERRGKTND